MQHETVKTLVSYLDRNVPIALSLTGGFLREIGEGVLLGLVALPWLVAKPIRDAWTAYQRSQYRVRIEWECAPEQASMETLSVHSAFAGRWTVYTGFSIKRAEGDAPPYPTRVVCWATIDASGAEELIDWMKRMRKVTYVTIVGSDDAPLTEA